MTDFKRPKRGKLHLWLAGLGLVLYWWMATSVSSRMGVTADEVVHLTGGYTYWTLNDYRLHPENGNLAQRIAALPLLGLDLRLPDLETRGWSSSQANVFGAALFYDVGNPVDEMLRWSRMAVALLGAFVVWLTWRWARGLFGRRAGLVALGLAGFCPALLAHGGLATSDMAMTACALAAISAFWLLLHRATWPRLGLAALACGTAFLAKMSGVLIIPVIGALVLLRALRRAPFSLRLGRPRRIQNPLAKLLVGTGLAAVVGAGSLVVLWAGFGFRYSGFNPDLPRPAAGYYFTWDAMLAAEDLPRADERPVDRLSWKPPPRSPGTIDRVLLWARDHRLLPEAYLWGFAQTHTFSRFRPAYLNGEYRQTGWAVFFPLAFLMKSTPASLLLFVAAAAGWLALAFRRRRDERGRNAGRWLYRASPLLVFFALYWAVALGMNLNIGHRHILPTYPVFYVIAASAIVLVPRRKGLMLAACVPAALILHAAETSVARPNYLSYFSSLVGGEREGYRHLVDSSYDWGQGLPALGRWIEERRMAGDSAPVHLSYFGADSVRYRGLQVVSFADESSDRGPRVFPARLGAGWYVVSATQLVRVYLPTRGPWTERHEELYRELHAQATGRSPADPTYPEALLTALRDYELMQASRLFHYLERREPAAVIGGSLLAYRLTKAEVNEALYGAPPY